MVPMDEPAVALDMISRFIDGKNFGSGPAKIQMSTNFWPLAPKVSSASSGQGTDYYNESSSSLPAENAVLTPDGNINESASGGRKSVHERKLEHQSLNQSSRLLNHANTDGLPSSDNGDLEKRFSEELCPPSSLSTILSGIMRRHPSSVSECSVAVTMFLRHSSDKQNDWIRQAHSEQAYNGLLKKLVANDVQHALSGQTTELTANVIVGVSSADAVVVDVNHDGRLLIDAPTNIRPDSQAVADDGHLHLRFVVVLSGDRDKVLSSMKELYRQAVDGDSRLRRGLITSNIGFNLLLSKHSNDKDVTVTTVDTTDDMTARAQASLKPHRQPRQQQQQQLSHGFYMQMPEAVPLNAFLVLIMLLILVLFGWNSCCRSRSNGSTITTANSSSHRSRVPANLQPHRQQIFSPLSSVATNTIVAEGQKFR
jgi:hypothetical protein